MMLRQAGGSLKSGHKNIAVARLHKLFPPSRIQPVEVLQSIKGTSSKSLLDSVKKIKKNFVVNCLNTSYIQYFVK